MYNNTFNLKNLYIYQLNTNSKSSIKYLGQSTNLPSYFFFLPTSCSPLSHLFFSLINFDCVLGLEFLDRINALVVPFADCLCILDPRHQSVVPVSREVGVGAKMISAIQFAKAVVRKEETTYLATLKCDEPVEQTEVPKEVGRLLDEFQDTMTSEFPKHLPPKREVDHRIELIPKHSQNRSVKRTNGRGESTMLGGRRNKMVNL
ncbi:hypothetical protein GQ457_10G017020 [Hibiscus cannabinus]